MTGKVLVVGGGIGGLSAAIALRQNNVHVDMVEIQKDLKVYHVGIIAQSNFVRAMAQLGVAKEAVAAGCPYKGWRFLDNDGRELARNDGVSTAGAEYPADLGLARPALHEVLMNRARQLGLSIRQGVTISEIYETDDHANVTFTDGSSGIYELVVGADGAYSKLRERCFGGRFKPTFTGQGVWRYNLPRPPELEYAEAYIGDPGKSIGTVPLTKDTMYIFIAVAEPGNPRFAPESLAAEMRKRLEGYGTRLSEIASQIVDPRLVVYRPMEVCVLPSPWYKGRVVLIGDAAHSTTPHLGQGAAMAAEDSVVLAEEIQKGGRMNDLLDRFMARRFERAKYVCESSIKMGEWQMHPSKDADPIGLYHRVRAFIGQPI